MLFYLKGENLTFGRRRKPKKSEKDSLFLKLFGTHKDVPTLLAGLEVADTTICVQIGEKLGELHENNPLSEEDIQQIISLLDHEKSEARTGAAIALKSIKSPDAVTALLRNLENENESLVIATADALARIGDPSAIPALINSYKRFVFFRYKEFSESLACFADIRVVRILLETEIWGEYGTVPDESARKYRSAFWGLKAIIDTFDDEILFGLFLPFFAFFRLSDSFASSWLCNKVSIYMEDNKYKSFRMIVDRVREMTEEEKCMKLAEIIHSDAPIISFKAFRVLQQLRDEGIRAQLLAGLREASNGAQSRDEMENSIILYALFCVSRQNAGDVFDPVGFVEKMRGFLRKGDNLERLCADIRSNPELNEMDAEGIIWNLIANSKELDLRDFRERGRRIPSSRRPVRFNKEESLERVA